jgi:hypothetical protein
MDISVPSNLIILGLTIIRSLYKSNRIYRSFWQSFVFTHQCHLFISASRLQWEIFTWDPTPTSLLARHDTSLLSHTPNTIHLNQHNHQKNKPSSQCQANHAVSQSNTTPPQQTIASSSSLQTYYLFSNPTMHPCKSTPTLSQALY